MQIGIETVCGEQGAQSSHSGGEEKEGPSIVEGELVRCRGGVDAFARFYVPGIRSRRESGEEPLPLCYSCHAAPGRSPRERLASHHIPSIRIQYSTAQHSTAKQSTSHF